MRICRTGVAGPVRKRTQGPRRTARQYRDGTAGPTANWFNPDPHEVQHQWRRCFHPGTPPLPTTDPLPLLSAPGGVQAPSPNPRRMHLSQSELDGVVAAAIAQWASAGASASQLAALHATSFSIADLSLWRCRRRNRRRRISRSTSTATATAGSSIRRRRTIRNSPTLPPSSTDLFTDPTNAAAGHLDMLTTVAPRTGSRARSARTLTASNSARTT